MNDDRTRIAQLLAGREPIRWVFAGDSITHGAAHTRGWRDYVELFGERVRWEMQRRRDCVIKTGVSGWKITDLAADLEWSVLQHRPHVVSIAFGMNDCTAGESGLPAFERAMRDTVERTRQAARSAIILHTPNPVLPSDTTRAGAIGGYVQTIRAIASHGVLVDHFHLWTGADASPARWLSDAIHPNELGHRLLARALFRTLGIDDPGSGTGRLAVV